MNGFEGLHTEKKLLQNVIKKVLELNDWRKQYPTMKLLQVKIQSSRKQRNSCAMLKVVWLVQTCLFKCILYINNGCYIFVAELIYFICNILQEKKIKIVPSNQKYFHSRQKSETRRNEVKRQQNANHASVPHNIAREILVKLYFKML